MQTIVVLTKKEYTWIAQQAQLIKGDELKDDDIISIAIDHDKIGVNVPNMIRSQHRSVGVDNADMGDQHIGSFMSEPANQIDHQ